MHSTTVRSQFRLPDGLGSRTEAQHCSLIRPVLEPVRTEVCWRRQTMRLQFSCRRTLASRLHRPICYELKSFGVTGNLGDSVPVSCGRSEPVSGIFLRCNLLIFGSIKTPTATLFLSDRE